MAYREVAVTEIREVLRAWLAGAGLRKAAEQAGVDRKTARRYVEAAVTAGLVGEGGPEQLSDGLVGQVVQAVRPARPGGHGLGWEALAGRHDQIEAWVKSGLTVVKIDDLLRRSGTVVAYRTLHRYCAERCGYGAPRPSCVRNHGKGQVTSARASDLVPPRRVRSHRGSILSRTANLPSRSKTGLKVASATHRCWHRLSARPHDASCRASAARSVPNL
jgi:hypothetical protein